MGATGALGVAKLGDNDIIGVKAIGRQERDGTSTGRAIKCRDGFQARIRVEIRGLDAITSAQVGGQIHLTGSLRRAATGDVGQPRIVEKVSVQNKLGLDRSGGGGAGTRIVVILVKRQTGQIRRGRTVIVLARAGSWLTIETHAVQLTSLEPFHQGTGRIGTFGHATRL